jgi:hypothetical protein
MTGSGCGAGRDRLYGRRAAGRHVEVTRCGDWAAGSQQAHRGGSISRVRGARVAGHDCERTLRVLTCAQIWIQSQVRIQVSLVAETDGQTLTGGHMAAAVPPDPGGATIAAGIRPQIRGQHQLVIRHPATVRPARVRDDQERAGLPARPLVGELAPARIRTNRIARARSTPRPIPPGPTTRRRPTGG